MTSDRRPGAGRLREERPAPAWVGDVELGVDAWVGGRPTRETPPVDPVAEVPEADHEAVARKILLDALTGQARSRKELADRLARKDVPAELADRLLDRFTEVGLIDDAAFARMWVESRHRSRGLAPRALAQELRRKGVDDGVVKQALELVDDDSQRVAARVLVDKRLRSLRNVDRTTATRRLAGLLARKGYPAGLAFDVVRQALDDAGHADDEDVTQ